MIVASQSPYFEPYYLVSILFTMSGAVLCWLRLRGRASRAVQVGWIAACGLLSWGMLLTCLAVKELPRFLSCPKCGKRRRWDEMNCRACNSPWAEKANPGLLISD